MRFPTSKIVVASALLVSACEPRLQQSAIHMIGGKPLEADHPGRASAVAVMNLLPDGRRVVNCSGTVVAPGLVLTAAHCVHPQYTVGIPKWIVFGDDARTPDAKHAVIEAFAAHPGFVPTPPEKFQGKYGSEYRYLKNDVAWIAFDASQTPQEVLPVSVLKSPFDRLFPEGMRRGPNGLDYFSGTPLLLAGYGTEKADDPFANGRRQSLTAEFAEQNTLDKTVFVVTQKERKKDTCAGDSGGPAYAKISDKWMLAGILSYGTAECDGTWSIYTHPAAFTAWVTQSFQEKFKRPPTLQLLD